TGIDTSHPRWEQDGVEIVKLANFTVHPFVPEDVEETANGRDDDGNGRVDEGFGHGTHVAGIVHLAAPAATLMIGKVLNDHGRGDVFGVATAMLAAIGQGAQVINLSLGLEADDPLMKAAVKEAATAGVAVVASAGNLHRSQPQYPAAYEECFAITAIDSKN